MNEGVFWLWVELIVWNTTKPGFMQSPVLICKVVILYY